RPLSALLTEPVAPELLYMEAKWSSLVSYGLSLDALQDFLPIDRRLDVKTVRYDTLKVAKRLEATSLNLSGFVADRSGPNTGQNHPFSLCARRLGPTPHTRSSPPAHTPSVDESCGGIERSPHTLAGWFC